jgi:type VI secretion system (T6SS) phospholipase Tle1-like effector
MWQPGDRIFLFGFSRGAYTVRCVAAVLALCGVPTRMKDGTVLRRDDRTTKKIATEAVKDVYQHVSSPKDTKYYEQRTALAQRFRTQYGSGADGKSNAYPHFIGVFDTVAAVANTGSLIVVAVLAVVSMLLISEALWFFSSWLFASSFSYWFWFVCVAIVSAVIGGIAYLATHIKVAFGLDGYTAWQTLHLTEARMKFYDLQLNPNVGWARHALAIDEHRADFDRVPWGGTKTFRETAPDEPDWLQQIWFAGNHSDVGGSYIENESRLSDASLQWMIEAAQQIPNDLKLDGSVLQLYPAADGMQHDECRGLVFRYVRKINRKIPTDAPLHPSVFERFKLLGVVHYDEMRPYRPEGLRHHEGVKQYY